jgi:uncharacterized membrane protein YdjX (TVP38/TMEM64 family)
MEPHTESDQSIVMNSTLNPIKDKWYRVIPGLMFIVAASAFALWFDFAGLKNIVQQHREISALISLAAITGLTFACIPSAPLALLVVDLHGPLVAIILVTLGKTLSGMIDYFIGGNITELTELEEIKKKLPFNLGHLPLNSPWLLFIVRIIPNVGPKFASVASGMAEVPFSTYLWITFFANLISGIGVVLLSTGLIKIFK